MTGKSDTRGAVLFALMVLMSAGMPDQATFAREDEALLLNNEGVEQLRRGEVQEAIAALEAARRIASENRTIGINLASAYIRQAENLIGGGQLEEAAHWLDQALGLRVEDVTLRNNLAATYNDVSAAYSRKKSYDRAVALLDTAVSLDRSNPVLRCNLGMALYNDNRWEEALKEFLGVAADDPGNVTARKMSGIVLYWKGQMKDAMRELEEAAKLDPSDSEIAGMLEKIGKEYGVEKDFDVDRHVNFTVSFDGRADFRIGGVVIDALDEAWLKVGNDFNFFPGEKIAVVIYSNEEFYGLTSKPKHVGGLYDGKIRVPVRGMESDRDRERLRQVLTHEYAHVVVHFLSHNRCPLWLNEGIAEYESENWAARMEERVARAVEAGSFIPLAELSDALKDVGSPKRVALAYREALSVVRFIVARHGVYALRQILESLDAGADIDTALSRAISLDLKGLEAEWVRALR